MDREFNKAYFEVSKLFNRAEKAFRNEKFDDFQTFLNQAEIKGRRWKEK